MKDIAELTLDIFDQLLEDKPIDFSQMELLYSLILNSPFEVWEDNTILPITTDLLFKLLSSKIYELDERKNRQLANLCYTYISRSLELLKIKEKDTSLNMFGEPHSKDVTIAYEILRLYRDRAALLHYLPDLFRMTLEDIGKVDFSTKGKRYLSCMVFSDLDNYRFQMEDLARQSFDIPTHVNDILYMSNQYLNMGLTKIELESGSLFHENMFEYCVNRLNTMNLEF